MFTKHLFFASNRYGLDFAGVGFFSVPNIEVNLSGFIFQVNLSESVHSEKTPSFIAPVLF